MDLRPKRGGTRVLTILGISGASTSGKSTLAHSLESKITERGDSVRVLSQDAFYKDESEMPRLRDGSPNWDAPESLDGPGFYQAIQDAKQELLAQTLGELGTNSPRAWLILEGFLLFDEQAVQILSELDFGVHLHIELDTMLQRRQERMRLLADDETMALDPPGYVEGIVWPQYEAYHRKVELLLRTGAHPNLFELSTDHCSIPQVLDLVWNRLITAVALP